MKVIRALLARVRAVFRRDAIADEIREELDFHLQSRVDEYEREGLTRRDARRKARQRIGHLATHEARGYRIRGGSVIDSILQDVRYGVRVLRRQPGFSAVAILTLALGIGASTAVISVIEAAILNPLPYPDAERLVQIAVEQDVGGGRRAALLPSVDDAALWSTASDALTHLAFQDSTLPLVLDGDAPQRLRATQITEKYLDLFAIAPVLGRGFTSADMEPGAPPVALISEALWQERFDGRRDAVGESLRYGDQAVTIVGVLPRTFYGTTPLWMPRPLPVGSALFRGAGGTLYGRLRPDIDSDTAALELTRLTRASSAAAGLEPHENVQITSLLDRITARAAPTTRVLAGAVLSVLLIACINVAGLLMARGYTRQPELVVRTAIGAGRGRLVRQLLTESLVLAIIGGVTGVAAAALMLDTLVANIPMTLPANSPARMNAAVLGYATALTLVTGVLFGLQPALRMTGRRSRPMVPVSGRVTGSLLTRRGGQILIGAEIVLAVVLVAGAGLMVRSLRHILDVDMGFDPASFMAMEVTLVDEGVDATRYYASLADTIRAMPGVEAVGAGDQVPLMGASLNVIVRGPDGTPGPVNARRVGRGYFHALGLPVVAGRDFNDDDIRAATVSSVVLGEAAARELFADTLALGRRITFQDAELEVVGVVRDIRHWGPLREGETEIYLPSGPALPMSLPEFGMTMVVRPTASVPVTADRLRHAAISIGPRVVVEDIRSGRDLYGATITTSRQRTVLLSLLGGLGLVLALVGIFGMTAYAVARRTREIGVRIALGARPDHVVRRMVADAAWPIAIGTVLGLGAATMATRVIESFLFETTPTDPVTFAAVAIVLATSGLVAAWVPARRAARVDPVAALRAE